MCSSMKAFFAHVFFVGIFILIWFDEACNLSTCGERCLRIPVTSSCQTYSIYLLLCWWWQFFSRRLLRHRTRNNRNPYRFVKHKRPFIDIFTVVCIALFFIDVDPRRAEKKMSRSEEEKKNLTQNRLILSWIETNRNCRKEEKSQIFRST